MSGKPVFIGGFRSGTTLLINLVGMHTDIAPWFETKSMCEALRWMHVLEHPEQESFEATYIAPAEPAGFNQEAVRARMDSQLRHTFARITGAQASGKAAHERYPIGPDSIKYSLAEAEQALAQWNSAIVGNNSYENVCAATGRFISELGEIQRQRYGRPRWVNKTPEITRFASELRDCLGGCKVIYMLRNGLDVVASAHKMGWGNVETLASNWKVLLQRTRQAMRDFPEDYLEIRYEDLLVEPARILNQVFAHCGESEAGLRIVQQFARYYGNDAFDVSRTDRRGWLNEIDLAVFNSIAGDLQAELGYQGVK